MLVNKNSISAVFVNLKATFNKAFAAAPSVWQEVAMKVVSTTSETSYVWFGRFPAMRKWIGQKHTKQLEAHKYSIVNDDFEVDVEVDRNDIEDDQLGIYGPQAEMAADSAKRLPDQLVATLMSNGFTTPCYDTQYFYDTDHEVAGNSVSNKGTAVLSIATLAAAQASYGAARTALRSMKDEEGDSLNVTPNILAVPPALEDVANTLMTADRLEDGKANIYKGTAKVVVMPGLKTDTEWHLIDTTKPVKPFILQVRKEPVFVSMTDMNSDLVYSLKKFRFGAEARMAVGYAFWQLAYGSTGQG
ncbi:Mu-like prophage major head subunit gpT family protein [Hydrogenovibrio sp. 3SP14C1]|uniref:Mu-like prophage major head subunit gpT family protein n=1 Tax=Hydrogenovibrio sp. 3SP14C1 TaxID=3038774 RepID=UPI002417FB8B|nr:Mu-like prophage major head subunit gpT family protein [Hydrogenovibrio sp. 3SP14C1]MDG4811663.1 Mu-like prophage major head subunit gpT family protein [Hydrogenovibrio sp. 3SP14C1]